MESLKIGIIEPKSAGLGKGATNTIAAIAKMTNGSRSFLQLSGPTLRLAVAQSPAKKRFCLILSLIVSLFTDCTEIVIIRKKLNC